MKLKTKKYLKISGLSVATLGFIGLMVGVSTSWNGVELINIGGSSAVMPLINSLSKEYPKADVITSAGGSGAGISSILSNTKEVGMASKDPKMVPKPKDTLNNEEKTWKDIKAKTITIAWDGIAIIYKDDTNEEPIDIDENSLAKIYTAFSGLRKIKMKDLNPNSNSDIEIIPYARNGGATTSGTADAFLNDSHIKWEESKWLKENNLDGKEIRKILQLGSYNKNVYQTAESNSQTWNRVKGGEQGSITYLSTGFILNNYKEITSSGFKIMTYKKKYLINHNENEKPTLSKFDIDNGYGWFRPFNLMVSLDRIKNNKTIHEFINWTLQEEAKEIIENNGYVTLSNKQIDSMKKNNEDLFDLKNSDWELGYCGAIKN